MRRGEFLEWLLRVVVRVILRAGRGDRGAMMYVGLMLIAGVVLFRAYVWLSDMAEEGSPPEGLPDPPPPDGWTPPPADEVRKVVGGAASVEAGRKADGDA